MTSCLFSTGLVFTVGVALEFTLLNATNLTPAILRSYWNAQRHAYKYFPDAWSVILGQLKDTSAAGVETTAALQELFHSVPPTSIPWGLIPLLVNGTPAVPDCLAPISVRDKPESVNEVISRWSPIVTLLCESWSGFGPALLVYLVEQLISLDNHLSGRQPTLRTFLIPWISHLLGNELSDVVSAHYLQQIGYPVIELLERCNKISEGTNEAAVVAAALASFVPTSKNNAAAAAGGGDKNLGLEEVEALLRCTADSTSKTDAISWKRCTTWTPCAIGMLPGYFSTTNLITAKGKRP